MHPTRAAGVRFDRVRRVDWQDRAGGFDAQQILSSLTDIWSCKMCSFTQSERDRQIQRESEQRALIQKPFQYPAYWLIDAPKLDTNIIYTVICGAGRYAQTNCSSQSSLFRLNSIPADRQLLSKSPVFICVPAL